MVVGVIFIGLLLLNIWLSWQVKRVWDISVGRTNTSFLESAFIGLLSVFILISWLGLILAEIGAFSLAALDLILLALASGQLFYIKRCHGKILSLPTEPLTRYDRIALLILIALVILYARPAEWILGGVDPGVYVNIGVSIAKNGSLIVQDGAWTDVAEETRALLFYRMRYADFHVRDLGRGTITPPFLHVLPTWIGILYSLGGLKLALFTTPLFGWLSLLAIYLLGRRLIHPGAGLFAMVLLGVNISQLWFSRSQFADIVLQFFLLSGFVVFDVFMEYMRKMHIIAFSMAALSAACFGICHLVKLDVFALPPVLIAFVGYMWFVKKSTKSLGCFLIVYLALVGHAALHAYVFSYQYVLKVFKVILADYLTVGYALLMTAGLLTLLMIWQRARILNFLARLLKYRIYLQCIFVVGVLVLMLYAYFVRPFRADLGAIPDEGFEALGETLRRLRFLAIEPRLTTEGGWDGVRTFEEEGVVRTGWYLTPMGVWLGVIGFLYWSMKRLHITPGLFLSMAFINTTLLFYRGTLLPYYFWSMKRYVPIVVPAFILCVAFLLYQLWPSKPENWKGIILPGFLGLYLLFSYVSGSLMFWQHIEYEGAIEDLTSWTARFPEDSLFISDPSLHNYLGAPMFHIYEHDIIQAPSDYLQDPSMRELITDWLRQDRAIYWLSATCQAPENYAPVWFVDRLDFGWPLVPATVEKLPDQIWQTYLNFCVYRIGGTDPEWQVPQNLNLRIGEDITLIGYELSDRRLAPGESFHLTLHFRAEQIISTDYKVFVHVMDNSQKLWTQKDHTPVDGTRPTSGWELDEVLMDSLSVILPSDVPPGDYQLRIGMYDFSTLERLPIFDEVDAALGDSVLLEQIEVVELPTE